MKHSSHNTNRRRWPSLLAAAIAIGVAGLLSATSSLGSFEQVGNFAGTPGMLKSSEGTPFENSERWPEEVQLAGVGGMAVNYTGAGGVPPGTLYAATRYAFEDTSIARFNPDGSFSERWNFTGNPPSERCGPDGDPAFPVCGSHPSTPASQVDVDVDQSTGNVYVFKGETGLPGVKRIHVYSPDGSKLIAEFGESAASGESTAASPGKLHGTGGYGSLAVDSAGTVYLFDSNSNERFHRLMSFKPQSPGDYEHYVYAGQANDVAAGVDDETIRATNPVADAAGNIYVAGEFGPVAKLDPSQPQAPPLCEFEFPKGGIYSLTVNPENGEAFFYTTNDKKVHQLKPCNAEGEFVPAGAFGISPSRQYISGLAFDPVPQFAPGRPAGILYGGAPSFEGGKTEKNKKGELLTESALGYIFAPPVELPPQVEAESVSHVTVTTAQLHAEINPEGSASRYVFQYLTEAEYEANLPAERFAGATETPLGGAVAGGGSQGLGVAASLAGLSPDTFYRYRALATSHCSSEDEEKVCKGNGTAQSFRTFALEAPGLPDHRAYELVSPVQKNGGDVLPADPRVNSCPEAGCKPGLGYQPFPRQSAPDGDSIVYEGNAFDSEKSALIENEYLAHRDPKAGWQTVNLTPTLMHSKGFEGYKAFDPELSVGVFAQTTPALSAEAPDGYHNLYTQPTKDPLDLQPLLRAEPPHRDAKGLSFFFSAASADLSRVFIAANDALTEETPFAPEAVDGGFGKSNLYEWTEGQLRLVNVLPGNAATEPGASFGPGSAHTISADGSRAFFSDEAGQLYVREDAERTREIPDSGEFLNAAPDGSKVLLANGHLYDLEAETTTDLSEGKGGFQGLIGESKDFSRLYFVDTAVLTGEEANERGDKAEAGKFNLYVWAEGGPSRYVATLAAEDGGGGGSLAFSNAWAPSPSNRTAEASPSGRWVTFLSFAPLTGYDNTGPCRGDHAGGYVTAPCPEVFLYDSATAKLRCVSCNRSGARPLGEGVLRLIGAGPLSLPQPYYLTDEGRLFFDSRDSLLPSDTNEGVEDVYEYEPDGVGTCEKEEGCLSLISAGTGVIDSNFLATDPSGKNAFFTTTDQLVLKDKDELFDLYVAREDGGIPAESEVARGECQGEACQPLVSAPSDPTPASSSFEGAGNIAEGKAKKKHRHKRNHAKRKHAHKKAAKHERGGVK